LIANCFFSIEIVAHQGDNFAEELQRAVRHSKADLIIMGIKGKSALAKAIYGFQHFEK
jgi:nucleotide-binding universal stress UspA family protein